MIFSPIVMADEYQNIEVTEEGNLILRPDQYVELANYIAELEANNAKLEAKLEQAEKELEKAYEKEKGVNLTSLPASVKGATLAAILILLVQNL